MNGQGRVIAGGTDLMLQMRAGALSPEKVINIKRLPELQGIHYDPATGLKLGALSTLRELTRSPIIIDHYPSLAQAAGLMASEQVRSIATVGGNLCNGSPSADLAPPLIALDGTAVIAHDSEGDMNRAGERHVPMKSFFLGPGQTALNASASVGELLKEIVLPVPEGKTIYLKHAPRAYMDIAIVGVAVRLQLVEGIVRQVRIVLAAVAPVPLRVYEAEDILTGKQLSGSLIGQAANLAAVACSPIDDVRGSAWYRQRMAEVLTRRALEACTRQ
jgi:carbon-monoxide dehydrogenase medium subunit